MANEIRNECIKRAFNRYYDDWNNAKGPRSGFHASSLLAPEKGTKAYCHREHILGIKHERIPSSHNHATLRIFANGWKLHEKWQELFKTSDVALYNEVEHLLDLSKLSSEFVPNREFLDVIDSSGKLTRQSYDEYHELVLSFTPDSIILYEGVPTVVEIKGYRTETYYKIANDRDRQYQYKDARVQANLYMYLLGLTKSIILIENKNDQEFLTIEEEYNHELILPYAKRAEQLMQIVRIYEREGKLVKGICTDKDSTRAKSCQMRDVCFAVPSEREKYRLDRKVTNENE